MSRILRCITLNTRSIRSGTKLRALQALCLSDEQDLICMQETFLDEGFPDSLVTGGTDFILHRRDRSGRSGGGVAILIRKGIQCSEVQVPPSLEVVALDISSATCSYRIICCYKPPNATPSYLAISTFRSWVVVLRLVQILTVWHPLFLRRLRFYHLYSLITILLANLVKISLI